MSVANSPQIKPTKKYVLQQSNFNLEVPTDKDQKLIERNVFFLRNKDDMFETENHCSPLKKPDKIIKTDAKKLRSIRLDLSSLKRGVIQKISECSSDESSEEDAKKKRKQRPVVPNYVTNSDSGPCRKPRQSRQDPMVLSSQSPKLAKPQPLSIARRNARERNRVKQVNEGFATLRGRIPEYIAEAYSEEKGRKSAKKLSKVETLRMAVDYIRHLETLLDLKTTDKEDWIKTENQPWDTPSPSTEYPSPVDTKYQQTSVGSPGTSYDQAFEYQERIFYEYDLDFASRKEPVPLDRRVASFGVLSAAGTENQCVDDFKYYETFNRLKKEDSASINDENVPEDEDEEEEEVENMDSDTEVALLPKPKDVIQKVPKKTTVLPSITETFSKGIPVFF